MKLTNHSKNNYRTDKLGTVCRGTISTREEYKKAYNYLWKQWQKAIEEVDTYQRDSLSFLQNIEEKGNRFCLGICATRLIVEKFNLENYKEQNYLILIKK